VLNYEPKAGDQNRADPNFAIEPDEANRHQEVVGGVTLGRFRILLSVFKW
jgi:hypothetical protein